MVEASGLRKSYGARLVLESMTLTIRAGEIVGLLGPNGAGKTTTLSILATLLTPDAGELRIAGADPRRDAASIRHKLGFVPQSIALFPSLSPLQNLVLFARVHGITKRQARAVAMRILEVAGLAERARDPVAILSGGMSRRLNLACAMVHAPELLLLDEPTTGVDPQSRERIFTTVSEAAAQTNRYVAAYDACTVYPSPCPPGALTAAHVARVAELVTDWHGQRWIDLPGRVRVLRRDGRVLFVGRP